MNKKDNKLNYWLIVIQAYFVLTYACMVIFCFVLLLSLPSQLNCSTPYDWANLLPDIHGNSSNKGHNDCSRTSCFVQLFCRLKGTSR